MNYFIADRANDSGDFNKNVWLVRMCYMRVVCACVCVCVLCMCACVRACVCVYVCMYVCVVCLSCISGMH